MRGNVQVVKFKHSKQIYAVRYVKFKTDQLRHADTVRTNIQAYKIEHIKSYKTKIHLWLLELA